MILFGVGIFWFISILNWKKYDCTDNFISIMNQTAGSQFQFNLKSNKTRILCVYIFVYVWNIHMTYAQCINIHYTPKLENTPWSGA